jgi:hypothetical protein
MEIIAIVFVVGIFAFLAKAGFIVYEVLCMNFDFNLPWPEGNTQPDPTEKQKASDTSGAQWKWETEELSGVPMYQQ